MSLRKDILAYVIVAIQAISIAFIVGLSGVACVAPFYLAARLLEIAP